MEFSEDQVRKIAALRDDIHDRIRKHQEEIEMLEGSIEVLDVVLKGSSFTKASSLIAAKAEKAAGGDSIPITNTGGQVMAKAYVTPEKVSIVLDDGMEIDADTHPFRSFFLERIIGGMKTKDASEADAGRIQRDSVIDCVIEKNGPHLREIIIRNYRQKERVNEIINTAGWSLARMLENIKK